MDKIIQSLSPIEKKIIPYLEEKEISRICEKSNLDKTTVLRALEYLQKKEILKLNVKQKKIIDLGVNGILYKRKELPERRLLNVLDSKRILSLKDAQKESKLSEDEFKVSIGVLKRKALIELKNGKIILSATKEEMSKKSLEELFIENLPIEQSELTSEQNFALKELERRKNILETKEIKKISLEVTSLGKKIMNSEIEKKDMIESLDQEILKKDTNWKGKIFRRYDVTGNVPRLNGGKRHFVNQALDYVRKIWLEMGFKEMEGKMIQSSFWNFDALFTAQDHPVREMQDTFFLNKTLEVQDKKLLKTIKETHEKGVQGSEGWNYTWEEEESKKSVLRTHTTCLSAHKLYELSKLPQEKRVGKFFALGKNFRNETVDWSHGFEFYQTEGIVIDPELNFRQLLGYLKQFYKQMGFEKIRFTPAYFPYTEPSVEVNVWHPEKKVWLELGGAGIFRPEITIPLLGVRTPVLAWGQGFDRIIMDYYKIKDLRELYRNDLNQLRNIKHWMK
ncbi:MAG: phenylalanine--tRNA ligase subunit alpha [Nanoarchaeota archaeon]|nr:phenylalanine--tRNA ligase subunit alpha [Nanoarchaeota archaeon]